MKKYIILLVFMTAFYMINAQSIYHPWIISAGSNFADFNVVNEPFAKQFQSTNWMGKKAPTMMRFGRIVKPYLSVSLIYTTLTLETDKLNDIPLDKTVTDSYFTKAGLQAEYRFTNGKLLRDEFFIDPYVFTGFSMTSIDEENYPGIPGGFGVNIWPLDYLGLNIQASYEYLFDFNDYFHYTIGITARFGNMIDKDRDRIADRYDACPEIWGLEEFGGCPDYDHDGVVDSLDQCPKDHGWPPASGCPDFDKDGVPDKKDACPCDAGPKKNNGCPENMFPPKEIQVQDTIIKTEMQPSVMEADSLTNETFEIEKETSAEPLEKPEPYAPVVTPTPKTIDEAIDPHLDNIHFEANSAAIKASSFSSLDKILEIMQRNPDKSFTIQGYTDVSGPSEYNLFLSQVRAKSIKEYFVNKGISQARLDAKGFGEIDDARSNITEASRAKNRRVEIYIK